MSETGAHLRLLEEVAAAVDRSDTIESAASRVAPEVRALTGWEGGRLTVGEVAATDPAVGPSGATESTVRRVPVVLDGEIVAELVFLAGDAAPPDADTAAVLSQVGRQLGRVVERERANRRYLSLVASVRDAVVTTDGSGTVTTANPAAERLLGYGSGELVGKPIAAVLPAMAMGGGALSTPVELQGVRGDGAQVPVQVIRTGGPAIVLRENPLRPKDQLHDPLTGLANRLLVWDRLEHALGTVGRRGSTVAVAVIDIDRFKMVNDSYGPGAGDALLVDVASRLRGAVRVGDTVGRVGGDEFAIVFEDAGGQQGALDLLGAAMDRFGEPFAIEGRAVAVSASVGVAFAPAHGTEAGQLLRCAEVAREHAGGRGRGQIAVFDDSMRVDAGERLLLENDLRVALESGQLRVHYQPIIDLGSRSLVGVEALVRWEHPGRGMLHPNEFIGVAEESGLIVPMGRWVLEQACLEAARWPGSHRPGGVSVSVNVSSRQFRQEAWAEEVADVLGLTGLEPGRLVLEITESLLMEDIETTRTRLSQLRRLGVRIAIDDFGTGYSSLGYLRQLPVDIIKVDKSFVDGVALGPHESALARAVIKLAATLDLAAVAEGVNSPDQFEQLRRLHCPFGQGYFFSPPVPPEGLVSLIDEGELALGAPGA